MQRARSNPSVAIACGGTGGHLFPGIAVAEELLQRDCEVTLLISPKEIDQQAVKALIGMEVVTLPAVGLTRGGFFGFMGGFAKSYRAAKNLFQKKSPQAVLAMGGFTSAPPIFAGRKFGAKTFLHESNSIPGRANRWLAHFVDDAFVYFHEASGRMSIARSHVTGMPVRSQFLEKIDATSARIALGLNPQKPVLLVMGGSQGASGINDLVCAALPEIISKFHDLQVIHLTGRNDIEKVRGFYESQKIKALVRPFLTEMEFALGAATVAISRSGALSLAEIAAVGVPAVLILYPTATDDHQFYNALAFVETGAARMFRQGAFSPTQFAQAILDLLRDGEEIKSLQAALQQWHAPHAASEIAQHILASIASPVSKADPENLTNQHKPLPRSLTEQVECEVTRG